MADILALWLQRVVEHLQSRGFVMFCKIPAETHEALRVFIITTVFTIIIIISAEQGFL